jgi:hypothetical protein
MGNKLLKFLELIFQKRFLAFGSIPKQAPQSSEQNYWDKLVRHHFLMRLAKP